MREIPSTVENDLMDAVRSAIAFGVSATEFKNLVAEYWSIALNEKREHDAHTFANN